MIRVALVNDLKIAMEALRRALQTLPDVEVAWAAENGKQAVQRCQADTPDVILMDMIMPVMDGVEATRRIMQQSPCPILVTTVSVQANIDKVFEAFGHGALDVVDTPVFTQSGGLQGIDQLARKVRCIAKLGHPPPAPESLDHLPRACRMSPATVPPLVAIGCSTGGPRALKVILAGLPKSPAYATIVVQHLDETFVPGLARWLEQESGLPVRIAQRGETPVDARVYIARTCGHLVLDPCGHFQYMPQADDVHCSSIDVFFDSLRSTPARPGTAVLLTGMGRDGAEGLRLLKDAGWHTIAQDEATSVVWGMPRHAIELGGACQVLPWDQIAAAIDANMTHRIRANATQSTSKNGVFHDE